MKALQTLNSPNRVVKPSFGLHTRKLKNGMVRS